MNFKLILMIILSSMALIFAAQNTAVVEVLFLSWRIALSSSLLIFATLMFGFVLGWFLHEYLLYRKSKESIYIR